LPGDADPTADAAGIRPSRGHGRMQRHGHRRANLIDELSATVVRRCVRGRGQIASGIAATHEDASADGARIDRGGGVGRARSDNFHDQDTVGRDPRCTPELVPAVPRCEADRPSGRPGERGVPRPGRRGRRDRLVPIRARDRPIHYGRVVGASRGRQLPDRFDGRRTGVQGPDDASPAARFDHRRRAARRGLRLARKQARRLSRGGSYERRGRRARPRPRPRGARRAARARGAAEPPDDGGLTERTHAPRSQPPVNEHSGVGQRKLDRGGAESQQQLPRRRLR